MLKYAVSSIVTLLSINVLACEGHDHAKNETKKIEKCTELTCVREKFDQITPKLVALIIERTKLQEEVADIKLGKDVGKALDEKRANEVVQKAKEIARKDGASEEVVAIVGEVFEKMVAESAKYQQKYMDSKIKK
ncbi:chorismate mutase [Pigmentibacter sp. JX0631]|uniref:chorismate mutase n=1 Tax=Pigmentibacter sp. JX0631 TaxID=2976982 RepID=UPI002469C056|nr:chorismate mutase [Pigmentibacter sp. JX0631]WGL61333.1 chorismate mutase [Pigmentibacter sp. JX0631]